MAHRYLTADQFRSEAKEVTLNPGEGNPLADAVVRTAFTVEKAIDEDRRTVDFTISTDSLDRHGDRVMQDGWKLEQFRKNPVVLWAHDYEMLPVGKAKNVRVEDGKLKATAEFTPLGLVKFNDIVFDLLKGGFLNATSVGFSPRKWVWAEADDRRFGIDFQECDLLEFSIVPIPANPDALIEGRAAGTIDDSAVQEWARKWLGVTDRHDLVERTELEQLRKAAADLAVVRSDLEAIRKSQRGGPQPTPRLTPRALELARLKAF